MRKIKRIITSLLLLTITLFNTSCGVIFHGFKQKIIVNSVPNGAEIYVNGESTGLTTPSKIRVKRRVRGMDRTMITYTLKKEGYVDFTKIDYSKFDYLSMTGNALWLANELDPLAEGEGYILAAISYGIDFLVGADRIFPKYVEANLVADGSVNQPVIVENITIEKEERTIIVEDEKEDEREVEKLVKNTNDSHIVLIEKNKEEVASKIVLNDNEKPKLIIKKDENDIISNIEISKGSLPLVHIYAKEAERNDVVGQVTSSEDLGIQVYNNQSNKGNHKLYFSESANLSQSIKNRYSYTFEFKKEGEYDLFFSGSKSITSEKLMKSKKGGMFLTASYHPIDIEKGEELYYVLIFQKALVKVTEEEYYQYIKNTEHYIKNKTFKIVDNSIVELGNSSNDIASLDSNYRAICFANMSYLSGEELENVNINEINDVSLIRQTKIDKSVDNIKATGLKYRRSSLYTMMIYDEARKFEDVIKNAFGNAEIPIKFNDHNIGPYLMDKVSSEKDQSVNITKYLNDNNVAKGLVSKWFGRDDVGNFNMSLISERGMYDASAIDKALANQTARGDAMLADAGEELIGNTFVIVNDYKFTNKEDIGQGVATGLKFLGEIAMVDDDVSDGAGDLVKLFAKGYIIKTISYLYRLEWNDETAAIFYKNHWSDSNYPNSENVEAFNKASNFKLRYIGSQNAWADVQSTVFSDKSDEDLIQFATVKATNKAIAKLQKKYEEFRTKTPLTSVNPLSAKIGMKEGVTKKSKFEVLEQSQDENGKTIYKRKGIVKVDGNYIWDNTDVDEEIEAKKEAGQLSPIQETRFKGGGKNYYPGMLIRQIK